MQMNSWRTVVTPQMLAAIPPTLLALYILLMPADANLQPFYDHIFADHNPCGHMFTEEDNMVILHLRCVTMTSKGYIGQLVLVMLWKAALLRLSKFMKKDNLFQLHVEMFAKTGGGGKPCFVPLPLHEIFDLVYGVPKRNIYLKVLRNFPAAKIGPLNRWYHCGMHFDGDDHKAYAYGAYDWTYNIEYYFARQFGLDQDVVHYHKHMYSNYSLAKEDPELALQNRLTLVPKQLLPYFMLTLPLKEVPEACLEYLQLFKNDIGLGHRDNKLVVKVSLSEHNDIASLHEISVAWAWKAVLLQLSQYTKGAHFLLEIDMFSIDDAQDTTILHTPEAVQQLCLGVMPCHITINLPRTVRMDTSEDMVQYLSECRMLAREITFVRMTLFNR
jgi:hypothetical protein